MSSGHIQRRGKSSWRLKFEGARDPKTGKRNIQYVTVHGTKREAKVKLAELIAAVGGGSYVEPTKLTVGDYVLARSTSGRPRKRSRPGPRSATASSRTARSSRTSGADWFKS
jgi:ERCC4-type nuclease